MVISTRSLWFGYPGGQRIGFPDIEVAQGGTLVLRGPSGAGKSTWLALVAGLQVPESGHLHVAHTDLRTLTAAGRDAWRARHVGFLPQRLHLSEALDVQGNLALAWFAAGRPADAKRLGAVLAQLSIADLAARRPSQLSGGQAQRVALARAVLLSPSVILADEPTANLDDESAKAALALVQSTARESGATLVIATHDARVLQTLGGGVAVCELQRPREATA